MSRRERTGGARRGVVRHEDGWPDEPPDMDRRVPPHHPEAEQAVLGAMLLDAEAVHAVQDIVRPEDFYRDGHRHVAAAIYALAGAGQTADLITVPARLEADGTLEASGGAEYVGWLVDSVPTAANAAYHAKLVAAAAAQRRVGSALRALADRAWEPGVDATAIAAEAVQSLLPEADSTQSRGFVRGRDLIWPAMEAIERRAQGEAHELVTFGLPEIDDAPMYGVELGDLVTLLMVSGHGKTALALSIGRWAGESGTEWGFVSAEMAGRQLVNRLLSSYSGIDFGRLRRGKLWDDDYPRLARASGLLASLPFHVDDTPAPSLADIGLRVRALKAANPGVRLVFVDYVQLLRADAETRALQIAEIANGLKALAKACGIVIVQLAQPDARTVDRRGGDEKMPRLDDVMWGQDIRFASDVVLCGYRPGLYDPMDGDTRIICEVQKSRGSGQVGFTLSWNAPTMTAWSPQRPPPFDVLTGPEPVTSAHAEHYTNSRRDAA